jgi:hypothetical protein
MTDDDLRDGAYDFDIAVSFAGADREFVEEVVERLKPDGLRVFYDADFEVEMWGEDLIEFFDKVYRVQSRYAVVFVSRHYADRMWARHERRSALARGLEQATPYVLPVRLDDTELEGLRSTVGYLDARRLGLDGIVAATRKKLSLSGASGPSFITRTPRSEAERQLVLAEQPPGWEYLYLAGHLLHERELIEPKFRDFEVGYAAPAGRSILDPLEFVEFLQLHMNEALRITRAQEQVMSQDAQQRAFGAPGEPGDPERIAHLARLWNSLYEGFLDWSATLRGLAVPTEFARAAELLARYAEGPVATYREFVDSLVASVDEIPEALAKGESLSVSLVWELAIAPDVATAYDEEVTRLRSAFDL